MGKFTLAAWLWRLAIAKYPMRRTRFSCCATAGRESTARPAAAIPSTCLRCIPSSFLISVSPSGKRPPNARDESMARCRFALPRIDTPLVQAHVRLFSQHERARVWLDDRLNGALPDAHLTTPGKRRSGSSIGPWFCAS